MRARSFLLMAELLAALAACRSPYPVLVRVDMPGVMALPAETFAEIVVTDFRSELAHHDLDPGVELRAILKAELARAFKGKVSVLALPEGPSPGPSFWREAAAGRDRPVFLTGSVRLASQVRKAVQDKSVPVDGPFKVAGRGFIERCHWTLQVDLVVISGASGEPVFRKTYRETRDYLELDKPADFAFSDLSATFRHHLFPVLLGTPTTEPRTLLKHRP